MANEIVPQIKVLGLFSEGDHCEEISIVDDAPSLHSDSVLANETLWVVDEREKEFEADRVIATDCITSMDVFLCTRDQAVV